MCTVGEERDWEGKAASEGCTMEPGTALVHWTFIPRGTLEKTLEVSGQEMRDGVFLHTSKSLVKGCACGGVNSQIIGVYCLQSHGSGSSRLHSDSLESAGYWELGWRLHGKEAKETWMDLLAWIGSTLIVYSEIKVL